MLRRLASGAALVAAAAMVLVGCTPPEPTETTDEIEATATLEEFYRVADAQYERGEASPDAFLSVATPEFAGRYAIDVQAVIDDGYSSRGVPRVFNVQRVERTEDGNVTFELCTDGSGVLTTGADGSEVTGQTVAWSARLLEQESGGFAIADLTAIGDESSCSS